MNRQEVDSYRERNEARLEELTIINAKQNSELSYIKASVDEIKQLVKEQNGRVRKNETNIAKMQGIGAVMSVIFSAFIGWLFKMKG